MLADALGFNGRIDKDLKRIMGERMKQRAAEEAKKKKPVYCAHVNSFMEEGKPTYKIVCRSCGTTWKGPGHMPKDIVIGYLEAE